MPNERFSITSAHRRGKHDQGARFKAARALQGNIRQLRRVARHDSRSAQSVLPSHRRDWPFSISSEEPAAVESIYGPCAYAPENPAS